MKNPAQQVESHGKKIWLNELMDYLRRTECLCLNCARLKPCQPDNCAHAQSLFDNYCKPIGLKFAITGCPDFVTKPYTLPKDESDMPDLTKENWRLIKSIEYHNGFFYHFYHDMSRPEIIVAAMTVAGDLPRLGKITRLTWQVGAEKRTVRLEIDEPVSVFSVIAKDGKQYDLSNLMKRLIKTTEPESPIQ